MPLLKIAGFDGVVPRSSATALADNQAQVANNVKLYSGELRTWNGPTAEYTPAIGDIQTIYELFSGPTVNEQSVWCTWTSVVDVAPSPIADQSDYRIYYSGDGVPKKTNWAMAQTGTGAYPRSWLNMGVPSPVAAPTVSLVSGSAAVAETRAYVYTYVSTFGAIQEESAPSPASSFVTMAINQDCIVSGFSARPTTGYNITSIRIYLTISGSTTGGNYAFVAEIPIATSSYHDSLTAVQLGDALNTIEWTPPPDDLSGLTQMANGVLAGFTLNTVYFSEPYHPHAWPLAYALSIPHDIVGLASYGTSLFVLTEGYPYIITGVTPGSLTVEKIPLPEPCISKRSIATDNMGIVYASPNGLVGISDQQRGVITQNVFRHEEWQQYTPERMLGTVYDGRYFGFFNSVTKGIGAMVLSRTDTPALCFLDANATAVRTDLREGSLYYCSGQDGKIYSQDSDPYNPGIYEWRSKRFVLPGATSFNALKVDIDSSELVDYTVYESQYEAAVAYNQANFAGTPLGPVDGASTNQFALNGSALITLPTQASAKWVQVSIYGDGAFICTATITSFDPIRLPPFKCREIEVMITGNTAIRSVALATSVMELHQ